MKIRFIDPNNVEVQTEADDIEIILSSNEHFRIVDYGKNQLLIQMDNRMAIEPRASNRIIIKEIM